MFPAALSESSSWAKGCQESYQPAVQCEPGLLLCLVTKLHISLQLSLTDAVLYVMLVGCWLI